MTFNLYASCSFYLETFLLKFTLRSHLNSKAIRHMCSSSLVAGTKTVKVITFLN